MGRPRRGAPAPGPERQMKNWRAIQQLERVIQPNSAASEEMTSTAEELSNQAEVLQSSIAFFTVKDAHATVRRATPRGCQLW